jgi:hypothetical protein
MPAVYMIEEIESAVARFDEMRAREQQQLRSILHKYANGEASLDESYCELLEEGLIPMPQRCGLKAKRQEGESEEKALKELIIRRLAKS